MSHFRNICAHEERLYSTKLDTVEIVSGPIHTRLAIPKVNGKEIYGKNDLFALLICLKEFLPNTQKGEFAETVRQIDKEINKLQSKLHTISIGDVLLKTGFPMNWKTL